MTTTESQQIAQEIYIYGYSLITTEVTRVQMSNVPKPQGALQAPLNQFSNVPRYPPADYRGVSAPNADTLYSVAWLDLSEPQVFSHPDMGERFFLFEIVDLWMHDLENSPSRRTAGGAAANYLITGPGWKGTVPAGMKHLPMATRYMVILGRTYANGTEADYEAVNKLQAQYRITPISAWGKAYTPVAPPVDPNPGFSMTDKPQSVILGMSAQEYFTRMARLMGSSAPPAPEDRMDNIRFGFGAGVDRALHAPFEQRFGFPLIEAWAMTETGSGGVISAHFEPRHVGTNCFGRPTPEVETRVVLEDGSDAPVDQPGELLVRRAGPSPRYGFFREYLKDPEATAEAWEGGWFHTGDVVRRAADGSFHFVDRKKNVIRRSGENISAVEVESVLQQHPAVKQVAVVATPDDVRGDEVLALVVPHEAKLADEARVAADITKACLARLAYYKAPGWISFVSSIPLTGTQKIQRGALKALAQERMEANACHDLRAMKKRTA